MKNLLKCQAANILTTARIICALLILLFPAFSTWFYILYFICGFTDIIDGPIARKAGADTAFGEKYDTIADFIFTMIVLAKIAKAVTVPKWLIIWVSAIIAVKLVNLIIGFIKYKQFVSIHSILNKACGIVCFIVPLFINGTVIWQAIAMILIFACLIASAAAVSEFVLIIKGKKDE